MKRTLSSAVAALSFLLGCRAEAPPKSQRTVAASAPSASVPSTSAPSTVPAGEPPSEPARFGPIRPITEPADVERLAFLKSMCEVGVQGATPELEQQFGCTCCPPFLECPPRADGVLVENPDHVYGIGPPVRGHFTRKDAEQELVTIRGCGTSMNGGSVAILDASGGKRVTASYEDFMTVPEGCEPYRLPDGHDLAVCAALSANQSVGRVRIVVGDFRKPEKQRWQELVAFLDRGISACFGQPGEAFVRETIAQRRFVDANGDRRLDLELDIDTLHAVSSQPFIDRCVAWLQAGPEPSPSTPAPWDLLDRPRRDRLVFVFAGSTFVATAATKRFLLTRDSASP